MKSYNFGKVAFITESPFSGKYPEKFNNARTEIAWQQALDSTHYQFNQLINIINYDHVFVIIPKGRVFLSAEGCKVIDGINPVSKLLEFDFVGQLRKQNNKKIHFIQEGPSSWPMDYTVRDQFNWYNTVHSFDSIFCHNESDKPYYEGMFPNKPVNVISSLMIEDLLTDIIPDSRTYNKVMIGGNFSKFYGGFNSYMVSDEFYESSKHVMDSHSKREDEGLIDDLNHLPRMSWLEWMRELSTYRYAIHLMPTVAAGTFSKNCGYFGIPCIGNYKMDTQKLIFPELSVDVEDIKTARKLAKRLVDDVGFYEECSTNAKTNYKNYFSIDIWKEKMFTILNNL
jgi:hypothetical protein